MALIRKTIRNDIAERLRSFNVEEVYTKQYPNPENADSYITVTFTEGETTYEDLQYQTRSELIIGLHKKFFDDQDELDDWAETIYPAVSRDVSENLIGVIPSEYEFIEDDEGQYDSVLLKFIVVYQGN